MEAIVSEIEGVRPDAAESAMAVPVVTARQAGERGASKAGARAFLATEAFGPWPRSSVNRALAAAAWRAWRAAFTTYQIRHSFAAGLRRAGTDVDIQGLYGHKLAFECLVLTAARSGEVRGARWDELDTQAHVWTIPPARMKMKHERRVPLFRRALDILDAARTLDGGDNPLVFPSIGSKMLHDMVLSGLLKRLKVEAVPHGSGRPSGAGRRRRRTTRARVIETALAHVVQNKVEAAYAPSDLFERRRRLMDEWGAHLADTHHPQLPTTEPGGRRAHHPAAAIMPPAGCRRAWSRQLPRASGRYGAPSDDRWNP